MTHLYHEGSGFGEVNAGASACEGEREEDTMGWDMLKISMAEMVAARNGLRTKDVGTEEVGTKDAKAADAKIEEAMIESVEAENLRSD